jgi:hypothetical protein
MLFFVLSGFLITTRFLASRIRTGSIKLPDFYIPCCSGKKTIVREFIPANTFALLLTLQTSADLHVLEAPAAKCAMNSTRAEFDRRLRNTSLILFAVALVSIIGLSARTSAQNHDFVTYWASARLLAAHTNPYDARAVWAIERAYGNQEPAPFLMRNPPWILPLIAPLGYLSLKAAVTLWWAVETLLAVLSMRMLQEFAGRWTESLATLFFFPLALCLLCGQTTIFVLFGCALFLQYCDANRPVLAGTGIALMALKPHLVLFFWPIACIEVLRNRHFKPLAIAATILSCCIAASLFFDIHVFQHYFRAMQAERIQSQFLANFSCWFRMLIAPWALWLQTIPMLSGLTWSIFFYCKQRDRWNWRHTLPLIVAVSTFLSPYSWIYDYTMLIPLILQMRRLQQSSVLLNALAVLANGVPFMFLFFDSLTLTPYSVALPLVWASWLSLKAMHCSNSVLTQRMKTYEPPQGAT